MLRLLVIAGAFSAATAYLHAPSALGVSRFAGARVEHYAPAAPARRNAGVQRSVVEAKKGKGVPIQNRGNQVAQEKMQERMGQMKPKQNGYPLFNLYVQTQRKNMWYPCGAFSGDDRSKSLVDGWIANALNLGGMVKGNIDKSVAASLFADPTATAKLTDQVLRMYPALKANKAGLEFGYKIEYEALTTKQEVTILTADMVKAGPLDAVKNFFSGGA